jgi:molybdate/tungstate transport system substrate-binding protein
MFSEMHPSARILHRFIVVASCLFASCKGGSEHVVQDSGALAADTAVVPRRLASDATLTIYDAGLTATPIRAVADSFGLREAVTVVEETARSVEAARKLTELGTVPDIIALGDAAVFHRLLVPSYTTWHVLFARDRIVLAYRDSAPGAATIDSTNWWKILQRRGVRVGRPDPLEDPGAYRALLVMQLAESYYHERRLAGKLAALSPGATGQPSETGVVEAIRSGQLDYGWVHESTARASEQQYLRLPSAIDLGNPADSASYAAAEVVLAGESRGDTIRVRGAPIAYGVSIPAAAPNPRHAERFLRFLLSDEGQRILRAGHLDVLAEPVLRGTNVPDAVASLVGAGPPG